MELSHHRTKQQKVVVCIPVVSTKRVQEEQWKASSFDPGRHGNGRLPSTQRGKSLAQDLSHNWQVADCDDCDAAAAAQRSAVTDEQLRANNLYHLNPTRKIPHTTGKLRKRAPSRKKRYPILFRNHPGIPDFVNFPKKNAREWKKEDVRISHQTEKSKRKCSYTYLYQVRIYLVSPFVLALEGGVNSNPSSREVIRGRHISPFVLALEGCVKLYVTLPAEVIIEDGIYPFLF